MNRIIVIVCGVMYDLLRKAPLLSVTRRGISLFAKRGATILEGVLYGVAVIIISNRFMALLSLENPPKEDKKVSKEDTVEDTIYFNVSVIILCLFFLVGLFSSKNPWYISRLFV